MIRRRANPMAAADALRPTGGSRGARGMTLLEILLAVTIMASLMGLVSALLGQARSWTEVSQTDRVLMHLQRVGEAMRSQWSDRRSSVSLDNNGQRVITTPTELKYLTATPLLFPEWPLVAVTYRIEPEATGGSRAGMTWRLVYEEVRIAGMDGVPGEHALDASGLAYRDSLVLLEGCRDMRWERFGRADRVENEAGAEDGEGAEDGAENQADGRSPRGGGGGASPSAKAPGGERGIDAEELEEDQRLHWREFTARHEGFVPAVRLVGTYEREPFGWVFVIKALR